MGTALSPTLHFIVYKCFPFSQQVGLKLVIFLSLLPSANPTSVCYNWLVLF